MNKSLDFYTRTLGLQITDKLVLEGGEIAHASVGFGSPLVMLLPVQHVRTSQAKEDIAENKLGVGVEIRIRVNGSRRLHELSREVKPSGMDAIDESETDLWWDKVFAVTDPDGYALSFWKRAESAQRQGTMLNLRRPQRVRRRHRPYVSIFSGG